MSIKKTSKKQLIKQLIKQDKRTFDGIEEELNDFLKIKGFKNLKEYYNSLNNSQLEIIFFEYFGLIWRIV